MNLGVEPNMPLQIAAVRQKLAQVVNDPACSTWLKSALATGLNRDCCDAAADARRLLELLDAHAAAMTGTPTAAETARSLRRTVAAIAWHAGQIAAKWRVTMDRNHLLAVDTAALALADIEAEDGELWASAERQGLTWDGVCRRIADRIVLPGGHYETREASWADFIRLQLR